MYRIGKNPINVPAGVDVTINGADVTVKGPKGTLSRTIPGAITVRSEAGDGGVATLVVERPDDERENRSLHGLSRTLVSNMVVGVTDGFAKELEIIGVGYRAEATVRPLSSSISCTLRCLFDRNTARRGRAAVPWIFLRTRRWRTIRPSRRLLAMLLISVTHASVSCRRHFLPVLPALRRTFSPR